MKKNIKELFFITFIVIIMVLTSCRPVTEPNIKDNNSYILVTDIFQNDYSNKLFGFGEIIRHTIDYNNIGVDFIKGEIQGYKYNKIFAITKIKDSNMKYINQYIKNEDLAKILIEIVDLLPRYLSFIEEKYLDNMEDTINYKTTLTKISELERSLNIDFGKLKKGNVELYCSKAEKLKKLLEEDLE